MMKLLIIPLILVAAVALDLLLFFSGGLFSLIFPTIFVAALGIGIFGAGTVWPKAGIEPSSARP